MTSHIHMGRAVPVHPGHSAPPVMDAGWGVSGNVDDAGVSTFACPAPEGSEHLIADVYNANADVRFYSFGAAPNAASDAIYHAVGAGQGKSFAIKAGDKVSVAAARS